ncbi:hypothetical protein Desaci_0671 [Desulfosporosinus acidiphilus SJ4]|uniref:Periplasmic/secreted protein n=1 Tax=Desulfosporosinus acidiphilus (strain DSM 22704 / JCM 16185 / SJ4) TaxID=646529 RepID=I4D1Q8_DESAJ|nr:hypothetical protein [Desulfosporosinus acidiphilus]AFM39732.1 hypothetical protein Desaci_0671 [Desulfosporosinus acidiphilus SJ4]
MKLMETLILEVTLLMFKIKDRIVVGAISGILSASVGRTANKVNYALGLTDIRYNPMAANLFLPKKVIQSRQGVLLGLVVNNIGVAANGIALTYLLSATGKDYKLLKGLGAGAFSWIMVDGFIGSQLLKIKSSKPFAPTMRLLEHLLYGALCSTLITKLGDDSLFPSKINSSSKQIPSTYTGISQSSKSKLSPEIMYNQTNIGSESLSRLH